MAFNYNSYLPFVTQRESGGNPNAQNPNSSASGLYQFTNSTYLPYAQKVMPGVAPAVLYGMKNRPEMQNKVMQAFTEDNAQKLQAAGIEPNNGSVYAAHFLGPAGAVKALTAHPSTPIDSVVSPDAIAANPGVFKNIRTVADFQNWASGSQGPMQTAMAQGSGNPADQPAPGAAEMSQQTGQSGFNVPQGPQSDWEQFKAGGPGSLFGMPQQDWNAGDALTGAGVAMMARDNPNGAAALASALRYTQKDKDKSKGVIDKDNNRVITQRADGSYEAVPINGVAPSPDTVTERQPSGAVLSNLEKITTNHTRGISTIGELDRTLDDIHSGKVDFSAYKQIGANNFGNFINDKDENAQRVARAYQTMETLAEDRFNMEKGNGSDRRIEQVREQIFPPGSAIYNTEQWKQAVLRQRDQMASRLATNAENAQSYYRAYPKGLGANEVVSPDDPNGTTRIQHWGNVANTVRTQNHEATQKYSGPSTPYTPPPSASSNSGITGGNPAQQQKRDDTFGAFARRRLGG